MAGCPIAPSLSKLALHSPCEEVFRSGLVSNLDTWIDDISADMVARDPVKVAAKSVKVFRMLQASLGQEQLTLSSSKSASVCTDKDTQKRLQQLLRPGEPLVLGLVKDLGVDSAGARRSARLQKAMGRSRKLGRLKVPVRKKRGPGGFHGGLHCRHFWPPRARTCPEKDESFEGGGRSSLRQILLWIPGLNL